MFTALFVFKPGHNYSDHPNQPTIQGVYKDGQNPVYPRLHKILEQLVTHTIITDEIVTETITNM